MCPTCSQNSSASSTCLPPHHQGHHGGVAPRCGAVDSRSTSSTIRACAAVYRLPLPHVSDLGRPLVAMPSAASPLPREVLDQRIGPFPRGEPAPAPASSEATLVQPGRQGRDACMCIQASRQ